MVPLFNVSRGAPGPLHRGTLKCLMTQSSSIPSAPGAQDRPSTDPPLPLAPRWAKLLLLPAVVSMVLALDQGTKIVAQAELAERRTLTVTEPGGTTRTVQKWEPVKTITVVPGLFNLRYVENPAAAFSLTGNFPEWFRKPFLVTVTLLAMILIISWYWRTREADWLLLSSFSFIMGGAFGNLVDRVVYGYVIDFIDWHLGIINPTWPHWPTFNIADSAICLGAAGVIWRTFRPFVPAPNARSGVPAPWATGQEPALVDSGRGASSESSLDVEDGAGKPTRS